MRELSQPTTTSMWQGERRNQFKGFRRGIIIAISILNGRNISDLYCNSLMGRPHSHSHELAQWNFIYALSAFVSGKMLGIICCVSFHIAGRFRLNSNWPTFQMKIHLLLSALRCFRSHNANELMTANWQT